MDSNFIVAIISVVIAIASLYYSIVQTRLAKATTKKVKQLFSGDDEYLDNVAKVLEKINSIVAQEIKSDNEIMITNFGLDLETVMPWIKNTLLENPELENIKIIYHGLIINPGAESIKNLIDGSSNIKTNTVAASIESAQHITELNFTGIDFEIKSYEEIPFFHGFIIDKKHLFISFTEVKNNKLHGGTLPYLYIKLDNTSVLNKHLFTMFNTWFNYIWAHSVSKVKFEV